LVAVAALQPAGIPAFAGKSYEQKLSHGCIYAKSRASRALHFL
jgi:hypothetical protein